MTSLKLHAAYWIVFGLGGALAYWMMGLITVPVFALLQLEIGNYAYLWIGLTIIFTIMAGYKVHLKRRAELMADLAKMLGEKQL